MLQGGASRPPGQGTLGGEVISGDAGPEDDRRAVATIGPDTMPVRVDGWTCRDCQQRVSSALTDLPWVASVRVCASKGQAPLTGDRLPRRQSGDTALRAAGYPPEAPVWVFLLWEYHGSITVMKVSVSLPADDVEFLDSYAVAQGLASRSAAMHKAVRLLKALELGDDYAAAWGEWTEQGDASAWEVAVADGLVR